MNRTRTFLLGAAVVAGLSPMAGAQSSQASTQAQDTAQGMAHRAMPGGRMDQNVRHRRMMVELLHGVDVTKAQRAQIRAIGDRYRPQYQAMMPASGMGAAQPDSAVHGRMRALMEQELADVRGVLSAAQQPTFDRNVADMRAHMQERMQGHAGDAMHGRMGEHMKGEGKTP